MPLVFVWCYTAAVLLFIRVRDAKRSGTDQNSAAEDNRIVRYTIFSGAVWGAIIAALLTGAKFLNRRVIAPVDATAEEMRQMAAGNFNIAISGAGRTDEIGQMAEAMHIFRETGIAKAEARAWEGARGLEWTVPSPAPHHTFTTPPVIKPGDLAHGDITH